MQDGCKISEAAQAADVKVSTIRYYERRGLLPEPRRRRNSYVHAGYRAYSRVDVARIRFIRNAQKLGFSLREIGELLALRVDAHNECDEVRAKAQTKIADIEDKIAELERVKQALGVLVDACADRGPRSECPILDALDTTTSRESGRQ